MAVFAALLISVAVAWIVEPVLGLVLALTDWGKSISPYLPSRATSCERARKGPSRVA